jgi:hypothetical protein
VPRETRSVGASPFHPDAVDFAEFFKPLLHLPVADGGRRKFRHSKQAALVIQGGCGMGVAVGIDACGDDYFLVRHRYHYILVAG